MSIFAAPFPYGIARDGAKIYICGTLSNKLVTQTAEWAKSSSEKSMSRLGEAFITMNLIILS